MERFHVHWLKAMKSGPPPPPSPGGQMESLRDPGGAGAEAKAEAKAKAGAAAAGGPPKMHESFKQCCEPFFQGVLEARRPGGEGPKCMIVDQFMGWAQKWAEKLQIPSFVLITSPTTFGYYMYNHSMLLKRDRLLERVNEDPIIELPGIPLVRHGDLSEAARKPDSFMAESGNTFGMATGLLFNSFHDLETSVVAAFAEQAECEHGEKAPKMLPIGPMLSVEFFQDNTLEGTDQDNPCIRWLNGRSPSSVVYIAFGSGAYLSEPQVTELANALKASKVQFLWILRVRSVPRVARKSLQNVLPRGFVERTKHQGFVHSEFAPQLEILSHSAIGGFLSHCGWNSALESMCKGVPMVGWPMEAEQKLCCRVLQRAKVTVPVRPELTTAKDLVRADELEMALRLLMVDPKGDELRKRAQQLQMCARKATSPGGSSARNIERLVQIIEERKRKFRERVHFTCKSCILLCSPEH